MRDKIKNLREKKPAYAQLIDFYEKIHAEQEQSKKGVDLPPVQLHQPAKEKAFSEGFPLLNRPDLPVDVPSSAALFRTLCKISKEVNEKLFQDVTDIELSGERGAFDIGDLIRRHSDEAYIDATVINNSIDRFVLIFLIHMSILPSLSLLGEQIRSSYNIKTWFRGYCPVCGSLPLLSGFRGEGHRFLICSFCSFEWQTERLKCPFCDNADHKTLHYFYAENEEAYRVDLCDKCRNYIKTIDIRKLDYEPDLGLEDITTIHLDILASEQGFTRPAPTPWIMRNSV